MKTFREQENDARPTQADFALLTHGIKLAIVKAAEIARADKRNYISFHNLLEATVLAHGVGYSRLCADSLNAAISRQKSVVALRAEEARKATLSQSVDQDGTDTKTAHCPHPETPTDSGTC